MMKYFAVDVTVMSVHVFCITERSNRIHCVRYECWWSLAVHRFRYSVVKYQWTGRATVLGYSGDSYAMKRRENKHKE